MVTQFQQKVLDTLKGFPEGKTAKGLSQIIYAHPKEHMISAKVYNHDWEHGFRVARIHQALGVLVTAGLVKEDGLIYQHKGHSDESLILGYETNPDARIWKAI